MTHPRSGRRPLPLKGATLAARQSRFRSVRLRGACASALGTSFALLIKP
jgi:hypothetical protein